MSFHAISLVTSIAAVMLAIGWLFAGKLMLKRWGIEPSVGALLVGRRIGVIYLAVALLAFLVRSTTSLEVITNVSIFAAVANALLAGLGLYEYRARRAGPAILISVAFEALLLLGFGWLLLAPGTRVSA